MKNMIKFFIFIIYTIIVFFIKDLKILIFLFVLNLIMAIIFRVDTKRMFYSFRIMLPFIAVTVVINLFLDSIYNAVIVGLRVIICYNVTYIISKLFTVLEIANIVEKLFYPLKIFKVNTNSIGMIVSVSICMIPILKDEMYSISQAMKSKGKLVKINSISLVMKPVLISIFKRTNHMENTLIAKGFIEE